MGKRGPKPGTGGRPIKYHDLYHVILRKNAANSRKQKKERKMPLTNASLIRLVKLDLADLGIKLENIQWI